MGIEKVAYKKLSKVIMKLKHFITKTNIRMLISHVILFMLYSGDSFLTLEDRSLEKIEMSLHRRILIKPRAGCLMENINEMVTLISNRKDAV